ncbi:hypothetical protein C8J57DRAFT_1216479 [Mycena rebaudengoi]|nr:hypothetical protein C8J57DRAFT_1216479 [Mycena rebaudengoi]
MPTQQKALLIPTPKADFVLGSHDVPSPGKDEVLVKTCADIAGVVEKVGEAVQGFRPSVRTYSCWFHVGWDVDIDTVDFRFAGVIGGGFQQYVALPAAVIIRMPQNLSFDEVSTAPITFTTACLGMFAPALIGAGRNMTHIEYLRQLGATEFIDRNIIPVDSFSTVPSLAEKVKVVDDATFAGAIDAAYDCVAQGGAIVTVQSYAPTARSCRSSAFPLSSTAFGKHIVENLPELFENGVILPNRVEIVANGLAAVPEALERMKAGGVSGVKLVVNPQDTK